MLNPFLQFFACLLIIFGSEVAAGVFGFLNKDKVRSLFHCFWKLQAVPIVQIHFSCLTQIIEDVQNFYAKTYNENSNGTLILSYQKVVHIEENNYDQLHTAGQKSI